MKVQEIHHKIKLKLVNQKNSKYLQEPKKIIIFYETTLNKINKENKIKNTSNLLIKRSSSFCASYKGSFKV